jgi:hypothetical protein
MPSVKPTFHTVSLAVSLAFASSVLVACGGGSSSSNTSGGNPTPPGGGTITSLIIEGSAATGAALPNAAVSIKCATGNATATTSPSGTYSATIAGGALPCVIRVTSTDGKLVLHSAIEGTGTGTVTANVTPLSELVLAQTQGAQAADMFDQFDANKGKLTAAALDDAKAKVRAALASIVDLTSIDPIKDKLVAANGSNAGNTLDQKLDTLNARLLAAQLKVQDLSALLLANTNTSTAEVVRSHVQTVNAKCAGLKTGTYRLINPMGPTVEEVSIDAATGIATSKNGSESLGTVNSCLITTASGSKLSLSPQGVGVVRTTNGNDFSFFLPKQDISLSDIAGTWSYVGRYKSSTANSYEVEWGNITVDSKGQITAANYCNPRNCGVGEVANYPKTTKSADGGFIFDSVNSPAQPGYAFRAASGAMMMVISKKAGSTTTGEFIVARKGEPVELPALNSVYGRNELVLGTTNTLDANFTALDFTVTAVDTTNKTHTRKRTSDCRVDVISASLEFGNLFERAAGTSANCAGTAGAISFSRVVGTINRGLGLSVYAVPATNALGIAVEK